MKSSSLKTAAFLTVLMLSSASALFGQMGKTWPSEKKIVPDPVTGVPLEFLTSTDGAYRQSKIYQTHRQWTVGREVADIPGDARGRLAGVRGERGDGAYRAGDGDGLHGNAVRRQQDDEAVCAGGRRRREEAGARRRRPARAEDAARGAAPAAGEAAAPRAGAAAQAAEAAAGRGRFSRSTSTNSLPTWPPGP